MKNHRKHKSTQYKSANSTRLQPIAIAMALNMLVQKCIASLCMGPTLAHRCIVPTTQLLNLRSCSSTTSPIQWLNHTNCNADVVSHASPLQGPSLNPAEVHKFASLADEWWDPTGPFAGLQRMNPARCRFIKDALCRNFGCVRNTPVIITNLGMPHQVGSLGF